MDRFVFTMPFVAHEGSDNETNSQLMAISRLSIPVAGSLLGRHEKFLVHPALAAIEKVRCGNGFSFEKSGLTRLYLARPESLAAAVRACNWVAVRACLAAGAEATLVSASVAMKLLNGCASDSAAVAAAKREQRAAGGGGGGDDDGWMAGVEGGVRVEYAGHAELPPWAWMRPPQALPRLEPGEDVALLRALLAAGASAVEDAAGEVPLVTAVWLGRLDYLALVAERRPDPNARDLVGDSALLAALYTGQKAALDAVEKLGHLDCAATNLRGDNAIRLIERRYNPPPPPTLVV